MSGLLALLDDVVALTKLAAATLDDAAGQAIKASSKAAGVVVDDAAVTPRYVTGLAAQRELPIIGRIALGSLKNKLVFLLPAALLLTAFMPGAIIPLLMLGGLYLCFEGFEKVHHMLSGPAENAVREAAASSAVDAKALEDEKVAGAIRTDFILSAEIMAIALASITAPDVVTQALVLAAVGVMITVAVYGAVALIVKADDFGVYLAQRENSILSALGRGLVHAMPPFLQALSFIGMLAMLWVGGGILVHGLSEYGTTLPEHAIHAVSEAAREALPFAVELGAWLAGAAGAAVVGLAAGAITALVVTVVVTPFAKSKPSKP
jgi:predicted DNA repair protein MutK